MRPRTFTDKQLLLVARKLFLEGGPSVSTASIAKALGVSQAAIFKRFSTKEELMVRALLPDEQPAWIVRLEAGPNEKPVSEQLLDVVREVDEFFARAMPAISIMRAAAICQSSIFKSFPGGPPPVRAHAALVEFFKQLDAQGRARAPHPEGLASAFLGAVHGRHTLRHALGDLAPSSGDNYAEVLVDLFWSGIRPHTEDAQ